MRRAEGQMILIGQFDSPFVRRVGIALDLYGLAFEHRPWSVFGDGDKIRSFNPLWINTHGWFEMWSAMKERKSIVAKLRCIFASPNMDTRV